MAGGPRMSKIDEELHVDTPPEVEDKPKKKAKAKVLTDTERARARALDKIKAK
jgi:hypothetical protein